MCCGPFSPVRSFNILDKGVKLVKTMEPVQPAAVGRVVAKIKVQNWADVEAVAAGTRTEPPRSAEVETLVDTGASRLCLHESLVSTLGLRPLRTVQSLTGAGWQTRQLCSPVNLEIMG